MKITIKTDYIKISQLLKLGNVVSQGSDVRIMLDEGIIRLNGSKVSERGKKVYKGDTVEIDGYEKIEVL